MHMTIRAALYLRISKAKGLTPDEQSYSIEDQETRCKALCATQGYEVAETRTYLDDGIGAFVGGQPRPGWQALRAAVLARDFDVLVFDRQDRLARDQMETLSFIIDSNKTGVTWHSVDEGTTDLTDPMQVMFAVFRGGDAQGYSKKISTNRKKADVERRAAGLPTGRGRPFGYEPDRITIREDEAALVREGIRRVTKDGATLTQVTDFFRESGINPPRSTAPWSRIGVRNVLTRWRNGAVVSHHDEPSDVVGVWDAIVDRQAVEEVRAILLGKSGGTFRRASTLLSGIAHCSCGATMGTNGVSYRCVAQSNRIADPNVGHGTISVAKLDEYVTSQVVAAFVFSPNTMRANNTEATKLADLYSEVADVRRNQKQLMVDRYGDEDNAPVPMTPAQFSSTNSRLIAQEADLIKRIGELARKNATNAMLGQTLSKLYGGGPVPFQSIFSVMKDTREAFDALSLDDKRLVVAATATITINPADAVDRKHARQDRQSDRNPLRIRRVEVVVPEPDYDITPVIVDSEGKVIPSEPYDKYKDDSPRPFL